MNFIPVVAALLLSSSASAATYVYQQNPNQGTGGRCGGALLPFQLTVTTHKGIPANRTVTVALKTLAVNAGGKYQFSQKYNKKHNDSATFTTDVNGDIIAWVVSGAYRHSQVWTFNDTAYGVQDRLVFKCGDEGSDNNPGTWTRTD